MQEFFMDYGLWLLVGLLIIIALVFLLSGKRKPQDAVESPPLAEPVAPPATPPAPAPFVDPIIAAPVAPAPLVIDPVVVEPAAPAEPAPAEPVVRPTPEPTPLAQPAAAAPAPAQDAPAPAQDVAAADDLLRLKGVGPKLKTLLIELGVTRYAQIAAWTDGDIATIDAKLGNFKGRPVRDQWVDQAGYLAAGDIAGFEAKYGKL